MDLVDGPMCMLTPLAAILVALVSVSVGRAAVLLAYPDKMTIRAHHIGSIGAAALRADLEHLNRKAKRWSTGSWLSGSHRLLLISSGDGFWKMGFDMKR